MLPKVRHKGDKSQNTKTTQTDIREYLLSVAGGVSLEEGQSNKYGYFQVSALGVWTGTRVHVYPEKIITV